MLYNIILLQINAHKLSLNCNDTLHQCVDCINVLLAHTH